ncbi:MAG: hypothetical protein FWC89_05600 [Defluviitaleaceae bacterium]|nr:hypothetical protein [Defluviitaleaceae bacterium]
MIVCNAQNESNSTQQNRFGETMHPSNFGGMYIDGDRNLVILTVERAVAFSDYVGASSFVT